MESSQELDARTLAIKPASVANAMRALENCPAAICLASLSGELLYINAKAEIIFGVAHGADTNGRYISDLFSEKSQLAELEAVARDGIERQFEMFREVGELGRRHLLCKLSRLSEDSGIPAWLVFVVFENDHRTALEEAVIDDAETLRIIRQIGGIAAWKMHLQEGQEWNANAMQWSNEVFTLLNVNRTAVLQTPRAYFDFVQTEDRRGMLAALQKALAEGSRYEAVYRLRPKNGAAKVILSRAILVREQASDAPQELWGIEQDISAAFSGLVPHSKASILDTVASAIDGPIYAVDRNCRFIYFNDFVRDGMRVLYGIEAEIGKRVFDFPDHRARRKILMANFRRAFGGVRVVEKIALPFDKSSTQVFEITYAPIMNASAITGVSVFGVRVAASSVSPQ